MIRIAAKTFGMGARLAALAAGVASVLLTPIATTPVRANEPSHLRIGAGEEVVARKLDLGIGKAVIVELPRDAKEVFVANPKVANAVVRSARKLFLIGMADGHTSIFVMDAEGRQIAALEVAIGRDMNSLRKMIATAMPNAKITITQIQESIILSGVVDSPGDAQQALDIAKGFVGQKSGGGIFAASKDGTVINSLTIRGRDQVMLKVTVAEVQRTVLKQLGINLNGDWRLGGVNMGVNIDNPLALQRQLLSDTLISGGLGSQSNISVRALERAGVLRTLAEPTLTAISGETAKFVAGGEIPVPTSSSTTIDPLTGRPTTSVGVTYRPFGVSLIFTPIVLSEGRISMRVATEVSELDAENQVRLDGVNVPAIRVRKADTTVELPSGGSLVTAGLVQKVNRQVINGFPGLMNLPVLGTFFRSRDYNRQETELMIIVTPFIAKPSEPGKLTNPVETFVDAHDLQSVLLGRLNKIYGVAGAPETGKRYRGHVGFIAD